MRYAVVVDTRAPPGTFEIRRFLDTRAPPGTFEIRRFLDDLHLSKLAPGELLLSVEEHHTELEKRDAECRRRAIEEPEVLFANCEGFMPHDVSNREECIACGERLIAAFSHERLKVGDLVTYRTSFDVSDLPALRRAGLRAELVQVGYRLF